MTEPPEGGPGFSEGDAGGWRLPESGSDPAPPPAAPPSAPPSAPPPAPPSPVGEWGRPAPPGWGTPPPGSYPSGWEQTGYGRPPTGIVPLRPLTVGEILDGAFQAVRANARTMVGTSAAVVATVTALSIAPDALLLNRLRPDPALTAGASTSLNDQLDLVSRVSESRAVSTVLTFVAVTMLNALL